MVRRSGRKKMNENKKPEAATGNEVGCKRIMGLSDSQVWLEWATLHCSPSRCYRVLTTAPNGMPLIVDPSNSETWESILLSEGQIVVAEWLGIGEDLPEELLMIKTYLDRKAFLSACRDELLSDYADQVLADEDSIVEQPVSEKELLGE